MLKALGSTLIMISCSLFGLSMAASLKRRERMLRNLSALLEIMRGELCASLRPVWEVVSELAERRDAPTAAFFADCLSQYGAGSFREAWSGAAANCRRLGLDAEECDELSSLGGVVGRYEAEKQALLLKKTIEYFDSRVELAVETRRGQSKICAALGIGSGLVLTILML